MDLTNELFEKYENAEITIEELGDIHPSKYQLVDIRDEVSHRYGAIPNSKWIDGFMEQGRQGLLDREMGYVLYCMKGTQSL